MKKHFELTDETKVVDGITVHRIRATRDNPYYPVRKGDLGGFVQSEKNLQDNAWAFDESVVMEDSIARHNSALYEYSVMRGASRALEESHVEEDAQLLGFAIIGRSTRVCGESIIGGNAKIFLDRDWPIDGFSHVIEAQHILTLGPIGSEDKSLVMTRQRDGIPPRVKVGCWTGTLPELMPKVLRRREANRKNSHPHDPELWDRYEAEYAAAITLCQARIRQWEAEGDTQ